MTRYQAAALQTIIREVRDRATKAETIRENVNRSLALIDYVTTRFGNAKLCVLPEFSLQGFDHWDSLDELLAVCITIPGPELGPFREVAAKKGIYIAGSAFEVDADWPGRWFNSTFLIDDRGEIALRYRKIFCGSVQSGFSHNTSPMDVYSEYVQRYGVEGLFPVADTPLGRLGMLVCYDICVPEVARCLALQGAEILLYPTGEPYAWYMEPWEWVKRARAFENLVYVISANHGAYYCQLPNGEWTDSPGLVYQDRVTTEIAPAMRSQGKSEIIDFNGKPLATATGPGEAVILAEIDLEALRRKRAQPGGNFLAQLPVELYAREYARARLRPASAFVDAPLTDRHTANDLLKQTVQDLVDRGIFVAPSR